jgi:cyclopropane-fatty-acyl-phospholipid synthase
MNVQSEKKVRSLFAQAGVTLNGDRPWDIQVHNPKFYPRILSQGSLGFGESYVEGWWDVEALDECIFRLLRAKIDYEVGTNLKLVWENLIWSLFNRQTKSRARKAVRKHYDLDNKLFFSFLDPYRQYSCAYFYETENLAIAQEMKMELICQKLQLGRGEEVLDIGCGWGGLAKYMAERYGCRVTGITLSREQARYAREFCRGLPVTIRLRDYRDIEGTYDKVVSIAMFEQVGYKNYRQMMEIVRNALREGGLFLLHTIGMDRSFLSGEPWLTKYIFPDTHIPSLQQLARATDGLFVLEDLHNFGFDYAKTLKAWHEKFVRNWPTLRDRYDTRFFRLWSYYLQSCRASFLARKTQLWQAVYSREGLLGGYESVRDAEKIYNGSAILV